MSLGEEVRIGPRHHLDPNPAGAEILRVGEVDEPEAEVETSEPVVPVGDQMAATALETDQKVQTVQGLVVPGLAAYLSEVVVVLHMLNSLGVISPNSCVAWTFHVWAEGEYVLIK